MQKDNTLKRLNRAQLLDMLYDAVKEKEDLEKELEETRQKLSDKNIKIAECGSIAEAALKLNKVFEQAQAAADQYLSNIREKNPVTEPPEAWSAQEPGGCEGEEELEEDKKSDAGWKIVRISADEDEKNNGKKLVKKLVPGAKVRQSSAHQNIFWTEEGTALFLRETGDQTAVACKMIPLEEILYEYYRKKGRF